MIRLLGAIPVLCVVMFNVTSYSFSADGPDTNAESGLTLYSEETITSNPSKTVILPEEESTAATSESPAIQSLRLSELQIRKQQSMERLNRRAEQLRNALTAKRAREALAAFQAQKAEEQRDSTPPKQQLPTQAATADEIHHETGHPTDGGPESAQPTIDISLPLPKQMPPAATTETLPETSPAAATEASDEAASAASADGHDPVAGIDVQPADVDGPVDRMALATSLFGTQSYRECLQVIDAIDRNSISVPNQDWCEYLSACCYRKLNDLPEAESTYRKLLGHTQVNWMADSARWWLDHLEDRKTMEGNLQRLKANLDAWEKEIDDLRTAD